MTKSLPTRIVDANPDAGKTFRVLATARPYAAEKYGPRACGKKTATCEAASCLTGGGDAYPEGGVAISR